MQAHSALKIKNHSSICSKTKRYFSQVREISTFKLSFYYILHAERSARDSQCRCNRIQLLKFNHSSIWPKTTRYFFRVWYISTFKLPFYSILHAEPSARDSQCRCKRIQLLKFHHSSIWSKTKRYFFPVWDISTFKRPLYSIVHAGRSARDFYPWIMPRSSKNSFIRRFDRILCDISLELAKFRRLNSHFTTFYTQNVVRAIASVDAIVFSS